VFSVADSDSQRQPVQPPFRCWKHPSISHLCNAARHRLRFNLNIRHVLELSSLLKSAGQSVVFWQKPVLIAPIGEAFSPIALLETPLEPSCINVSPRTKPLGTLPSLSQKTAVMLLKFHLTCLAFSGVEITGFSAGKIAALFLCHEHKTLERKDLNFLA